MSVNIVTGPARPAIELRYTGEGANAPKGATNPHPPGSAAATWWQRGNDNQKIEVHPIGALLPLDSVHLQSKRFTFLSDSQDIEAVCMYLPNVEADDVSAMLVHADDGDYLEVWSTGYARPYLLSAVYERVL